MTTPEKPFGIFLVTQGTEVLTIVITKYPDQWRYVAVHAAKSEIKNCSKWAVFHYRIAEDPQFEMHCIESFATRVAAKQRMFPLIQQYKPTCLGTLEGKKCNFPMAAANRENLTAKLAEVIPNLPASALSRLIKAAGQKKVSKT